ncbi:beta-lactamase class A [Dyadobacter jejuensis]|uniref:Beta-lactamase n=1 Tax=Dyadobacter jejuensis TaxID=1082580 RepID=A0A316AA41_9BACT|nr:class A beta-lactamase, subclass A2 [Dyadobacter jejuensis]PWJ54491.1 beta-lactamase class A [Dyadobacter jejuensis]
MRILFLGILFSFFVAALQAQDLREAISTIVEQAEGKVGVGVLNVQRSEPVYWNENHRFPMQSVFKFPLALAVLDRVDKGELDLQQVVPITRADLPPHTWSPIRDKYPSGDFTLTVSELLQYTVSQSDNNGCDLLFRLLGGPARVDAYIKKWVPEGIAIVADEAKMATAWEVQFGNYATPVAMSRLFQQFYAGQILSAGSTAYLKQILLETNTCTACMKGLLPEGARVAHKTGRSATNAQGITAATNDAGVLLLPNGQEVVVVVFVGDSPADDRTREGIIAQVSRAVWDHYLQK